ncbi:MAG: hypothetical protein IJ419_12815 [Agathobacter sp.]|nr:hypothetical protein [Agathobacter sp.]
MNYQEFLDYIKDNLAEMMNTRVLEKRECSGEDRNDEKEICYEAHIHTITKNNGIVLDGVTLLNKDEQTGPNIYLNNYFESYQMGKPLQEIMEEIIICHEKAKEENSIEIVDILNFNAVKEKIVVRLVNYEKNAEQLKDCPHKRYLDLAITFRYLAGKDAVGLASSLIGNKEFEYWNIELEELYQLAIFNTMREFPWKVESLLKVVTDCFGERLPLHLKEEFLKEIKDLDEIENRVNMFVLSNDIGLNGATCLLYDNVLRKFADIHETNLYVLPSSVHEGATRFAA